MTAHTSQHRMLTGFAAGLVAGLAGSVGAVFTRDQLAAESISYLIPLAVVAGIGLLFIPRWRRFGGGVLIGAIVATALAIALAFLAFVYIMSELGA